ncbi:UNVERIFIED_CONTAM: hypothetical protein GTU68_029130 [Idotea baltica]|nr:hypothetical protein [Idotea baltica]
MEFIIRDAQRTDMKAVFRLIQELAEFEKEADQVAISVTDLERYGFGTAPAFQCFVAESAGEIMGIALTFMRFSTWKGPTLHLEDLIVTEQARGHGLGNALLNRVVQHGHALGVRRIQWEVLDWNDPAIKFYEQKGAHVLRDWNVVHLREDAIQAIVDTM